MSNFRLLHIANENDPNAQDQLFRELTVKNFGGNFPSNQLVHKYIILGWCEYEPLENGKARIIGFYHDGGFQVFDGEAFAKDVAVASVNYSLVMADPESVHTMHITPSKIFIDQMCICVEAYIDHHQSELQNKPTRFTPALGFRTNDERMLDKEFMEKMIQDHVNDMGIDEFMRRFVTMRIEIPTYFTDVTMTGRDANGNLNVFVVGGDREPIEVKGKS